MTAPLHERLAEAAKQKPVAWIDLSKLSPKGMVYATGFHHNDKQSPLCRDNSEVVAKLCEQVRVMKEALEDLVRINESHNFDWIRVVGKPIGWSDKYLDAARSALEQAKAEE